MSFSVSSECHQPKDFIGPKICCSKHFIGPDFISLFLSLSECHYQCLLNFISPKISLVRRLFCLSECLSETECLSYCLSVCLCKCYYSKDFIGPYISMVQRLYWCLFKSF